MKDYPVLNINIMGAMANMRKNIPNRFLKYSSNG
jgi:hypothetical protein